MTTMSRLLISGTAVGLGLVSVFALFGCNRTISPGNTTVQGRVTFQGQPMSGGLVVFSPDLERGGIGKPISAETAQDGRFQLTIAGDAAIPPGWYRVAIAAAPNSAVFSANNRAILPTQLARPDQSGLSREVKAGQENSFEFAIDVQ
jgi:hypothetical protein